MRGKSEEHRENMIYNAKRVVEWIKKHYPKMRYWHEMRQAIVIEFIDDTLKRDVSTQTVKLLLNPLRLAQNWLQLVEPDAYRTLRFAHPKLVGGRMHKRFVERETVVELLETVRSRKLVNAELIVMLCGFCGLRVSECVRMSRADVDQVRNLVTTGMKTKYSERTIPVPAWVVQRFLEIAPKSGPCVRRDDGTMPDVKSAGHWYLQEYLDKLPTRLTARDLRKCFQNHAIEAGCPSDELRAYTGQRPVSVLESHYVNFARPDMLRERIVNKIETHFSQPVAEVKEIRANG